MICPHCGYSLDDGVAFCIYCGTRLGKYAEASGADAAGVVSPLQPASSEDAAAIAGTPGAEADAPTSADGSDGLSTPQQAGEPVPDSAWEVTGDYSRGYSQDADVPSGPLPEEGPAAPPAEAAPAPDQSAARLHDEGSLSRRMDQAPRRRTRGHGRKSRKGLGAVIAGVLLVAAIAVGGLYVVPSLTDGGDAGPGSTSTGSGEGTGSDSGSSSSSSSSSGGSRSSSSTEASDKPETRYGSTLSKATSGDEEAVGQEEGVADAGAGGSADSAPAVSPAGGGASYPAFAPGSASATSVSPTEGSTPHGADLVLDGIETTAWNTNESGIGESITITTGRLSTVNGLRILGGYNKISYNGTDLYWANSRPRDILIEWEGGSREFTMADAKGEYQDISINPPATTTWIRITIRSVYQGGLYDDCCISEIKVY